jgi:hypothetical protein
LLLDGVTVSGNHFRRVRYVDMKHEFAFVVSKIPALFPWAYKWVILFTNEAALSFPLFAESHCRSLAIPMMLMKQGTTLTVVTLMGAA